MRAGKEGRREGGKEREERKKRDRQGEVEKKGKEERREREREGMKDRMEFSEYTKLLILKIVRYECKILVTGDYL